MTMTNDIAALCAAIDEGDDTALGPLSDAIADAMGLDPREPCRVTYSPDPAQDRWAWLDARRACDPAGIVHRNEDRLPHAVFARLRGGEAGDWLFYPVEGSSTEAERLPTLRRYPTRSAAFLALAAALAEEPARA